MTAPLRASASKKKPAAEKISSETIAEQTAAFLKSGGEIGQIKSGVSGQTNLGGTRHITLGKKPTS